MGRGKIIGDLATIGLGLIGTWIYDKLKDLSDWLDDTDEQPSSSPEQPTNPEPPRKKPTPDDTTVITLRKTLHSRTQQLMERDGDVQKLLSKYDDVVRDIEKFGQVKPYQPRQRQFMSEFEQMLKQKLEPDVNRILGSKNTNFRSLRDIFNKRG